MRRRRRSVPSLDSSKIKCDDGYLKASRLICEAAKSGQIRVADGRRASATVLGADSETDLALLKTELSGLSAIETANSDNINVGDVVLAIGNPYGFSHSVSLGIVSGLERYGLQLSAYENYIQTDATIHLGNSGGALIDSEGQLVGINTLIYPGLNDRSTAVCGLGINLATPSNLVSVVMSDLIEYGSVIRGWLGVSVDLLMGFDEQGRSTQSLLVTETAPDGLAQRAARTFGTRCVPWEARGGADARQAMQTIAGLGPGERVTVGLRRNEDEFAVGAIVSTRPIAP